VHLEAIPQGHPKNRLVVSVACCSENGDILFVLFSCSISSEYYRWGARHKFEVTPITVWSDTYYISVLRKTASN